MMGQGLAMSDALRVLLHTDESEGYAAKLRAAHPNAQVAECQTYQELPALMAAFCPDVVYTVRFAGTPDFPRDALFADGGPRWVANGGAGTDHFGMWDPSQTTVTNAAGVAADMMAEYVMGGFLHFTLDIPGLQSDKARKVWSARMVRPLMGQTLLVIGLGHSGRAVAARAKAFGMTVIGTRAHPQPMDSVDEVFASDELRSLLPRADFIVVSTPLTLATRKLLGPDEFSAMKPGVILADISRGGVVDQTALLAALKDGTVGGAALDVFETEPLAVDNPLWSSPNTIISPHCSSVYEGWADASFDLFLKNLARWATGQKLVNIVDPTRGY